MSKYKPGDVVRLANGRKAILILEGRHSWGVAEFTDSTAWRPEVYDKSDIKGPWREPLTAEFECEWRREGPGLTPWQIDPKPLLANGGAIFQKLDAFEGKRTRVKIEEII